MLENLFLLSVSKRSKTWLASAVAERRANGAGGWEGSFPASLICLHRLTSLPLSLHPAGYSLSYVCRKPPQRRFVDAVAYHQQAHDRLGEYLVEAWLFIAGVGPTSAAERHPRQRMARAQGPHKRRGHWRQTVKLTAPLPREDGHGTVYLG